MKTRKVFLSLTLLALLVLAVAIYVEGQPVQATEPAPAAYPDRPVRVQAAEGDTGYTAAKRIAIDYPGDFNDPDWAIVEIYADVVLSKTTEAVTMSLLSRAGPGGSWVTHSSNVGTFTGSSPSTVYTMTKHRGTEMAVSFAVGGSERFTPTVDVVLSNR